LTPTDYQRAIDHFEAINEWMDRGDSPLHGLIELFYAQGGFMIGATVARHATDAEFDIDIMAQVAWPAKVDPETALATTHKAIRGTLGSRYYEMCERKTRCSTVQYSTMHLDVTPSVRVLGREERTSLIFHSKGPDQRTLYANPYGFGEWFIANTPADEVYGQYFEKASLDHNRMLMETLAKADAEPIPAQAPVFRKSRAVIALQLIKRWRNLAYDRRHATLRLPPSVLLAYFVAANANQTRTLADELLHQVERMIAALQEAERRHQIIHVCNPMCPDDVLTDRWPATFAEQRVFIGELRAFAVQLHRLCDGLPLAEMQRVLEDLFGEKPARDAIRKFTGQYVNDNNSGTSFHILRSGSIPALGSAATPAIARPTPKSSPWGD
jgi:hypothetical protein